MYIYIDTSIKCIVFEVSLLKADIQGNAQQEPLQPDPKAARDPTLALTPISSWFCLPERPGSKGLGEDWWILKAENERRKGFVEPLCVHPHMCKIYIYTIFTVRA